MPDTQKVLLLDDDSDLLEVYKQLLSRLPSQPEIHTATSGARAISLLESTPFTVLVSDLNMPKMDGLEVLSIVRRRFPELRTVVLTSVVDEHFRSRAYGMGVDLYICKPLTSQEVTFFLDCIESLLGRNAAGGFRGIQSKSLVDIIQLECLSQSSSVLRFTNGPRGGRIWIQNGEIVDAEAEGSTGQEAFQNILGWKTGAFEMLPPDSARTRTIFASYQGLLLECAQAIDEAANAGTGDTGAAVPAITLLASIAKLKGVEFLVEVEEGDKPKINSYGIENAEAVGAWLRKTMTGFKQLGEKMHAGDMISIESSGSGPRLALIAQGGRILAIGIHHSMGHDLARDTIQKVRARWVS